MKNSTGITELNMSAVDEESIIRKATKGKKSKLSKLRKIKARDNEEALEKIERRKAKEQKSELKNKQKKKEKFKEFEKSELAKKLEKKTKKLKSRTIEEKREAKRKFGKESRTKNIGELIKKGEIKKAKKKLARIQSTAVSIVKDISKGTGQEIDITPGSYLPNVQLASEAEFLAEYQHIYTSLGNIIRKLEEKMNDPNKGYISSKDVYALMTMYSQMRETMADMRSIKDLTAQAEDLAIEVFDPAAKSAGESLIAIYYALNNLVRTCVVDKDVAETINEKMKEITSEQGRKLQQDFSQARGRILEVMNGTKQ